jgi:hypothetical protein
MHVPMALLIPPLRIAEAIGLGHLLPITSGQLSPFRYDTTIQSNSLFESRRTSLCGLTEMLKLSFAA